REALDQVERFQAVRRLAHVEALGIRLKQLFQPRPGQLLVVDDQHAVQASAHARPLSPWLFQPESHQRLAVWPRCYGKSVAWVEQIEPPLAARHAGPGLPIGPERLAAIAQFNLRAVGDRPDVEGDPTAG